MNKILIVDDQRGIRLLLDEVFSKEGYETYLAATGLEALEIFETEKIECILLDMKMPGMNGLEILKRIREVDQEMPVLMMTAFGEQDIIDEATNLGVIKYFSKPFNIFEVLDEVNNVLK